MTADQIYTSFQVDFRRLPVIRCSCCFSWTGEMYIALKSESCYKEGSEINLTNPLPLV